MITQAQIDAQNFTTALTPNQVMVVTMLVKRYLVKYNAVSQYSTLGTKLQDEVDTPTVVTSAIKAVLAILGGVPTLVVESSGSDDSRSFFSTVLNWEELAQDILNVLYENPIPVGTATQSFAIAQRRTEQIALKDRVILTENETGRRW